MKENLLQRARRENPEWRDAFKSATLRTNFLLSLTRSQLEYIASVADNVVWDRFGLGVRTHPYNTIAVEAALVKRGLIERKKSRPPKKWNEVYEIESHCVLTEAGKLVVELLKLTGIFIEQENATMRKAAVVGRLK